MATNDETSPRDSSPDAAEASASPNATQPDIKAGNITDNTGNVAVGSDINQNYAARDHFSGPVTINNYGNDGTPKPTASDISQASSSNSQPASEQQDGTNKPLLNAFALNQKLKQYLDEPSMRDICSYINAMATYQIGLSYDDLIGTGPGSKSLSLINFCQMRKALTWLIDGINVVRPELLGSFYAQWRTWAVNHDSRS